MALRDRIALTEQFLGGYQDRLQERIAELRKGRLGPWLLEMVRQRLDEIREKEVQVQARFDEARQQAIGLSGQLLQIQTLERDEKRFGNEYDELFKKITDLDLRRDGSEVRTAVIQQPQPGLRPVSPRLSYVLILVVLGGFGAGLALVHLLDALDDRFRSLDEMQNRLGVAVLSMVQQMKSPDTAGLAAITMHSDPTSLESEAFRTLRTALDLSHPDARQVVISSAEPGDGKTTVLANLAVGYAQSDKKTLLIDADLRRPGLTRMMDLRGMQGLSEILRSDGDIAELAAIHVQASGLKGLDILPSGPRPTNPHELLAGTRFSQFLAWAAGVYDQILIDSPPALATSDTAIIGRLVDGVILVVQPAKNRRRLVTRMVESLSMLKIPILGLVINRVGSDRDQGYYSYHSGYGYGYGHGYGYGYGYGSGYGAHEEGAEGAHVGDETCSPEETIPATSPEESQPPPRTIRRRAA
jgi:capsular exopolysaccharide synthesis family protein